MPKVSVIIPVYNAKDYLERCLNSVVNQTLKNIEIICVDDCSTDNSLEILKKYAEKYPQMKVISHKENGGESKARNTGLDAAKGEYIAFVDNDDVVDLDFYERLYANAKKQNADISKGNQKEYDYSGKLTSVIDLNSLIRENDDKMYLLGAWWTAIYRHEMIKAHNIRLPEGYCLGGDMYFVNLAAIHANKIVLDDNVYYHHLTRENSGDSRVLSTAKVNSALQIFEIIEQNINEAYKKGVYSLSAYVYAYHFYIAGFYLAQKAALKDDIYKCINSIFKIYDMCLEKEELIKLYESKGPFMIVLALKNRQIDSLINYFLEPSNGRKMAMELRAKLKVQQTRI